MTAATLADPHVFRDRALERRSWWRCLVQGIGRGTVTGTVELGTLVTTYRVQLDTGDRLDAWPAAVQPLSAPGPVLLVIRGGRR